MQTENPEDARDGKVRSVLVLLLVGTTMLFGAWYLWVAVTEKTVIGVVLMTCAVLATVPIFALALKDLRDWMS